jgi:YVTN family beta-propeller protein
VSLPAAPTWIAITPDGASAYVSLTSTGGVAVIATGTNIVTATITLTPLVIFGPPIPASPQGLAVTPDGAFVYVATNFPQTGVHRISTATNTDVTTIVGPYGTDLLVTPNGASVYVSDGDSTVSVIDTATNTQSAAITFPGSPGGIEVQPGGAFVWVGGYTNGTVPIIDTATNTIATTIATGGQPLDVAFAVKQQSPQDQIAALIADINALVTGGTLAQNKANALITKLNQVLSKLDVGQTGAACNQLNAFANQVDAYVNSHTLTQAEGQALTDAVNAIKSDLGC